VGAAPALAFTRSFQVTLPSEALTESTIFLLFVDHVRQIFLFLSIIFDMYAFSYTSHPLGMTAQHKSY